MSRRSTRPPPTRRNAPRRSPRSPAQELDRRDRSTLHLPGPRTQHRRQSLPPADLHARTPGCSTREAHDNERRSDIIDAAPAFGDALATGHIGTAHVDALANATAKLDEAVRDDLFGRVDDLLDSAKASHPNDSPDHSANSPASSNANTASTATNNAAAKPSCHAASTPPPA